MILFKKDKSRTLGVFFFNGIETVMSYLPLAHAAGHINDAFCVMEKGGALYFADKDALRGTLVSRSTSKKANYS